MPANFITRWFGISQPLFQRDRHEANLFNSQEELFISEQRYGKKDAQEGEGGYTVSSDQKPPLRSAAGAVCTGVCGRPPVRVRGWLGGMFSLGHKFPEHSRGDRCFRETHAQDGTNAHADSESNTHKYNNLPRMSYCGSSSLPTSRGCNN